MSIFEELRQKFLSDLQTGIRVPIKISEEEWGEKYIGYQELLKGYCANAITKMVFLSKYKTLPQIESIPKKEKDEWKEFVNETFPGTPPDFRLDAVKIIYTIGILTNE